MIIISHILGSIAYGIYHFFCFHAPVHHAAQAVLTSGVKHTATHAGASHASATTHTAISSECKAAAARSHRTFTEWLWGSVSAATGVATVYHARSEYVNEREVTRCIQNGGR